MRERGARAQALYLVPTGDPFLQTLRVSVEMGLPVDIVVVSSGARDETLNIDLVEGYEEWVVFPGEVIKSCLRNPFAAPVSSRWSSGVTHGATLRHCSLD